MKEVTVVIAGRSGQGKSTVANIIKEALKAKGVAVRVFDNMNDVDDVLEEGTKSSGTNVMIKTVTTSRNLELIS